MAKKNFLTILYTALLSFLCVFIFSKINQRDLILQLDNRNLTAEAYQINLRQNEKLSKFTKELDDSSEIDNVQVHFQSKKDKNITRVISTHPDEDHICGLEFLDNKIGIVNFYCVKNDASKEDESESFKHYCTLRDGDHHYYVEKGCSRCWMNKNDGPDGKNYGSSEIDFLWPVTSNEDYQDALLKAKEGKLFNNISPIFTYSLKQGAVVMWMGERL